MGIWESALDGLGALMAFFYNIIPNYGVSIILLTIVVRLALFPLTVKQIKSMRRMQEIQPEIKKLQVKYKGDRQKLNEEVMKFYQENKVNPLGGCLPLLFQMPVFIALTRLLYNIQNHVPRTGSLNKMYGDICGIQTPKQCKNPELSFIGMNLSKKASAVAGSDLTPYVILIVLVMATAYFQQQQSMKGQTSVQPQMQMIARIMPIFMGFISFTVPSGLTLYFVVGNVWQIGQQRFVYQRMGPVGSGPGGGTVIDVPGASRLGSPTSGMSGAEGKQGFFARLLNPQPPESPGPPDPPDAPGARPASPNPPKGPQNRPGGQGNRSRDKKRRR